MHARHKRHRNRSHILKFGFLARFLHARFLAVEDKKHQEILRKIPKGKWLLDGGCGWGQHSKGFDKKGKCVVALDITTFAMRRYGKCFPSAFRVKASLESLPFKSECIDNCILQDSLEHVTSIRKVLVQIKRILKKGGVVVATVPNWYNRFLDFNPSTQESHRHHHTSIGWRKLFYEAGFASCSIRCIAFPIINTDFLAKHLHLLGAVVMLKAIKN